MRVLLAAAVLLAWSTSSASALECYACKATKKIGGITLAADITSRLSKFPTCEMMEEEGVSEKYEQKCLVSDKGCVNIVDPNDPKNRLRSCFPLGRDDCQKSACYCTSDLCNGGAGVWASAAGVAAALLALMAAAH